MVLNLVSVSDHQARQVVFTWMLHSLQKEDPIIYQRDWIYVQCNCNIFCVLIVIRWMMFISLFLVQTGLTMMYIWRLRITHLLSCLHSVFQRQDCIEEVPTRDTGAAMFYDSPERLSMNSLKGGNSVLSLFPDDDSGFE